MNMGTPDPIANQGKILKSHGIKRVKLGKLAKSNIATKCHILPKLSVL